MPWAKLDDGFDEHPKFEAISDGAFRLYVNGLTYSCRVLTDGFISFLKAPARVPGKSPAVVKKLARELVDAGLWEVVEGGWQVHDFCEYQPTRERVREGRRLNRERQARHRDKRVSNALQEPLVTGDERVSNSAPTRTRPERYKSLSQEASELLSDWIEATGITSTPKWVLNNGPAFQEAATIAGEIDLDGFVKWAIGEGCFSPKGLPGYLSGWSLDFVAPSPVEPCDTCDSRTWTLSPEGVAVACPDCRATWKTQ